MTKTNDPDTFPRLLLAHAQRLGERPAIREKKRGIWRTTSWRVLADEAMAICAALAERGVGRGSHVALVGDNRPRLYAAICATHWLGAVAVPLYQDAGAEEMAGPIRASGATHVFAENQEQVDKLLEILPRCRSVECIVYDDDRGMRHYSAPHLVSYEALVAQGRSLSGQAQALVERAESVTGDAPAFLFFTSGTTGTPKGVVLTHAALIEPARAAATAEGIAETDVAMAYLPPGWIGQILFGYVQPMVAGYCICCPESSETMLADMREIGPTYLLLPPRVLDVLLAQVRLRIEDSGRINQALYRRCVMLAERVGARLLAGESVAPADRLAYAMADLLMYGPLRDVLGLGRVRVAFTAGDCVDPGVLMYFRSIGVNLKYLYGSTETGFLVAMQRNGGVKADTVGPPAPGVEIRITAEREIQVRSAGLFVGYHGDPEGTARTRDAEGWFRTGDVGYLGDDGHLRIIDRVASLGSLNDGTPFVARNLENRLKLLPWIREAVAFGRGRERVCVLVDIDPATVGRWAGKRDLAYTGHADLASRDEVYALVGEAIAAVNAQLASDPALSPTQVHRFAILHKELDADDGVLTRTGKLRRTVIEERFAALLEAMYGGGSGAPVEAGAETMELKIRDVGAASSARRAA